MEEIGRFFLALLFTYYNTNQCIFIVVQNHQNVMNTPLNFLQVKAEGSGVGLFFFTLVRLFFFTLVNGVEALADVDWRGSC